MRKLYEKCKERSEDELTDSDDPDGKRKMKNKKKGGGSSRGIAGDKKGFMDYINIVGVFFKDLGSKGKGKIQELKKKKKAGKRKDLEVDDADVEE